MRTGSLVLGFSLVLLAGLSGCDQLGIETPKAHAEKEEADGKAIGAACRHAGRAIEDCYVLNKKADKAAIFAGWREMDEYMRENKMETVSPVLPPEALTPPAPKASQPAKPPDDGANGDDGDEDSDADSSRGSGDHGTKKGGSGH
jgi:hypothetical protein